jgi:hypothetical protein
MFKKTLLVMVAVAFLCVPALAGDRPEFDAVCGDDANFFNDFVKNLVVANNPWNTDSDWCTILGEDDLPLERFEPPVQLSNDWCFPGYQSAFTQWRRPAIYRWYIVLQMDPQSDLDINIVDCVVKHNSKTAFGTNPFEGASQTGRYELPDGTPIFNPGANPQVTAVAHPGANAVFGFVNPFDLVNRTQGGLFLLPFRDLLYTSKALWEEGLVARMPEYLVPNLSGQTEYPLSAGDIIEVDIFMPPTNPVDVRYGQDNVIVKYVGIDGTIATP